jgi:L-asparagine transporter-like permease
LLAWNKVFPEQSPFVTTLRSLHIPYADMILNGVMIAAAFSTMVAAMFAVTRVLLSLGKDGEAPRALLKRNGRGVPVRALLLSSGGLLLAVLLSFLLPKTVYELLTTSAGIILVGVWLIILWTHHRFRRVTAGKKESPYRMWGYPWRNGLAALLILLGLSGSVLQRNHVISLMLSLGTVIAVMAVYRLIQARLRPQPE